MVKSWFVREEPASAVDLSWSRHPPRKSRSFEDEVGNFRPLSVDAVFRGFIPSIMLSVFLHISIGNPLQYRNGNKQTYPGR